MCTCKVYENATNLSRCYCRISAVTIRGLFVGAQNLEPHFVYKNYFPLRNFEHEANKKQS